ncbi:MAG: adenosylmethionine decarboxylase [Candidatus Bathyarchaeota archaeon]|nr:MAG: adenosylmethionine decarboxylase [Candidatus Bathyarchaeota archaeon]
MEELKRINELLVDLYGCQGSLDSVEFLVGILRSAARSMGSKVVKTVSHKFSPTGITVILILAETHISIHTWPEYHYAALDIFICSEEINPKIGWEVVKDALKPSSFNIHEMTRRIT